VNPFSIEHGILRNISDRAIPLKGKEAIAFTGYCVSIPN